MNFIVSASTDIGNTKTTNQDSLNVKVMTLNGKKMVMAVLCDGMGGLEKGEVASASVVNAFHTWSVENLPTLCMKGIEDGDIRRAWTDIVSQYNEKIKNYGKNFNIRIGTTVAVMLLTSSRYYIMNVGDTRAYEIHSYASVLTKDHTLIAREVELGNLTEEQALSDSHRSVLLQGIGASDAIYPDLYFGETKKDTVYMLCTDGFRHEISLKEIYLYFHPNRMISAESMKENELALIKLNKQRQERDNISVITIRTF